jgi:hypothetical protein
MHEESRTEHRVIRQAFGNDARLVETGPTRVGSGLVEIHVDGHLLGSGRTFRSALADSLSFSLPGIVRGCDIPAST